MNDTARSKGEITKEKILHATLELISESGIETLSHRNIAKRADVRLSLTSYYFGSLDNLICEAFDVFFENEKKAVRQLESQAQQLRQDGQIISDPEKVIQAITEIVVEYIMSSHEGPRHQQASIDSAFYFSLNQTEALSLKLERFNQFMEDAINRQLKAFLPEKQHNPLDASLILSIVRELEHQVSNRRTQVNKTQLEAKLSRILALVVSSQDLLQR